jgi:hypothetical protein
LRGRPDAHHGELCAFTFARKSRCGAIALEGMTVADLGQPPLFAPIGGELNADRIR